MRLATVWWSCDFGGLEIFDNTLQMLPVIYSFQLTQLIGMRSNKSADPADSRGNASENGGQEGDGALTRPAQEEGQLQEQDSKLAASSAGRQAN